MTDNPPPLPLNEVKGKMGRGHNDNDERQFTIHGRVRRLVRSP